MFFHNLAWDFHTQLWERIIRSIQKPSGILSLDVENICAQHLPPLYSLFSNPFFTVSQCSLLNLGGRPTACVSPCTIYFGELRPNKAKRKPVVSLQLSWLSWQLHWFSSEKVMPAFSEGVFFNVWDKCYGASNHQFLGRTNIHHGMEM